jgi:hypothetical protein
MPITGKSRTRSGGRTATEFRQVAFEGSRLTFEWDIGEWFPTAAPIAVEAKQLENKGTIRVVAVLSGDRLVGSWHMFVADGTEVFRGEWEATRAPDNPTEKANLKSGVKP